MSFRRFRAVLAARNREFWRDRSALAWNILFPVMIVAGFAFAFSNGSPDLYKVGVVEAQGAAPRLAFQDTRHVRFIPVQDPAAAIAKVERHQLDMLLDLEAQRYWVNDSSPGGYLMERLLQGETTAFEKQAVSGEQVRYVDWLVSGVLAMNIMFSALFGVGFVIVRYRKNGVLKRLKATPLSAMEFLAAQMISRLWLLMAITVLVFIGTDLVIDFRMRGSYLDLALVFLLGTLCLISMGLLVAARIASEEVAGGLVNVVSWPMMFLSGVWFSLEGLHPWLQQLAQLLPLTHVIDAARAIMIDGAGLLAVWPHLAVLAGMSVVFLLIGARMFRWE